jgi:hypothetical protein
VHKERNDVKMMYLALEFSEEREGHSPGHF